MNKLLIWKYLIIFIIFHFHYVKNELIFVYEHCRHGARGSIINKREARQNNSYIDKYKSHWDGSGKLTIKGKMQQYILGISNRYKYPNIIKYNK